MGNPNTFAKTSCFDSIFVAWKLDGEYHHEYEYLEKFDGEYKYEYEYREKFDGEYEYEYEYCEKIDGEYEYEYEYVLVLIIVLVPNLAM